MDSISLFQFAVGFALSIIFSAFAIGQMMEHKEPNWELAIGWNLVAAICWFTFGVLNASMATDPSFVSYSWLYMALGMIFVLFSIVQVIKLLIASGKTTSIRLEGTD